MQVDIGFRYDCAVPRGRGEQYLHQESEAIVL